MIDFLYQDVSFVEDLDRVASLISDDIMRDELQWLNFLLLEEVLLLLFLRLLLPTCYCFVDADEHLPGKVDHNGLDCVKRSEDGVIFLVVSELMEP